MTEYYVVRDKNTGLYFRGKGVNRWGKYYNQASIYRIKANAENTIEEVSWRGAQAEVVPIQIVETTADVVEVRHGEWKIKVHPLMNDKTVSCSECGYSMHRGPAWDSSWGLPPYCQECGARMDGGKNE